MKTIWSDRTMQSDGCPPENLGAEPAHEAGHTTSCLWREGPNPLRQADLSGVRLKGAKSRKSHSRQVRIW